MTEKVLGLSLFYLIVWCISPPLSYGTIFRLAALGIIGGVILYDLLTRHGKMTRRHFYLLTCIAYIVFLTFLTGDGIGNRVGTLIMLATALSMESIVECFKIDLNKWKWLVPASFILCILWNLCTLREIAITPNIMRVLAKNSESAPSYAMRGVGGYGYMYTVLLLIPMGINYMMNKGSHWFKRAIAVTFVVSTYMLALQSQYFMAILIAILMPLLYLVYKLEKVRTRTVLILFLLVLFFVAYMNADRILMFLLGMVDKTSAVAEKIQELYNVLQGEKLADTEFSTRLTRYGNALNYAITHPILGGFSYKITGNHSFILDIFAQYGFIAGGFILFQGFLKPFTTIREGAKVKDTMFVCFIIIALLNVIPFAMGCVLYILMPIYEYGKRKKKL